MAPSLFTLIMPWGILFTVCVCVCCVSLCVICVCVCVRACVCFPGTHTRVASCAEKDAVAKLGLARLPPWDCHRALVYQLIQRGPSLPLLPLRASWVTHRAPGRLEDWHCDARQFFRALVPFQKYSMQQDRNRLTGVGFHVRRCLTMCVCAWCLFVFVRAFVQYCPYGNA